MNTNRKFRRWLDAQIQRTQHTDACRVYTSIKWNLSPHRYYRIRAIFHPAIPNLPPDAVLPVIYRRQTSPDQVHVVETTTIYKL